MSQQKRNNRSMLPDGRLKRGMLTSMYGKSPQKFLESSNEQMPSALPYIQATQTQHIILDQNQLSRPLKQYHEAYSKQANVYLDPLYNSKQLNTAAFGVAKSGTINDVSSFNFLNQQAVRIPNHIASKPVFFDGSINSNARIQSFQNKNQFQFINQNNAGNPNITSNHSIPVYVQGKNLRDVNFGTNYNHRFFESHNPPMSTVVPPQFLDGNIHTIIEGNIKKSYIPQHIFNQIPLYQTENYNQNQYNQRSDDQQNGQTYQVMLSHYEKLFQKFQQQKDKNSGLDHRVHELQAYISKIQNQINNNQKQKIQQPKIRRKRKTLDKAFLQDLLKQKIQFCVSEIINRRKNNAINRLRDLFTSSYSISSTFQQHKQVKFLFDR